MERASGYRGASSAPLGHAGFGKRRPSATMQAEEESMPANGAGRVPPWAVAEFDPGDGGPIYAETDLSRVIAEPWNAASASVFVLVALVWMVRLRGRYREHPFLTACLPL